MKVLNTLKPGLNEKAYENSLVIELKKQGHTIEQQRRFDGIVRIVRFPGWQDTATGEREVKQALRRALLKYKLHTDQDLFDKAYSYIREYY